jgi:non-ribosomal peptide synthetase component F
LAGSSLYRLSYFCTPPPPARCSARTCPWTLRPYGGEVTTSATRPGRQDAAALLRRIHGASLFLVALDDERTSYRYHHLVLHVLRAWPVSSKQPAGGASSTRSSQPLRR